MSGTTTAVPARRSVRRYADRFLIESNGAIFVALLVLIVFFTVASPDQAFISAFAIRSLGAAMAYLAATTVVANAGIAFSRPLAEVEPEDYDRLMAVNVRGVWLGLKYVMQAMEKSGGSIVVRHSNCNAWF